MPPIPPDIVRLQYRWEALGEIAVNNLHVRFNGPAGDWALRTQEIANKARDLMVTRWSNMATFHGSQAKLRRIDAYHLSETDGKTLHKATASFAGAGLSGSGAAMMPLEVAICVSLYGYPVGAYDPQGARKRGRIFLPFCNGGAFNSDGRVAPIQAIADAWAGYINDLHGQDLTDDGPIAGNREIFPVVLSRTGNSYATIQHVRVDNLGDVQKRRQNNLIAAVATANITQE